jgi:hypothetical protein
VEYECIEDILGRARVLSEILNSHLLDLEEHLRSAEVCGILVNHLENLSSDIFKSYDRYMSLVEDITRIQ